MWLNVFHLTLNMTYSASIIYVLDVIFFAVFYFNQLSCKWLNYRPLKNYDQVPYVNGLTVT